MLTAAQQKFIDTLGPMAKAAQDKTKVPASVTIAQAILETGWGHHTIADANNLFGIKGVGPAGSVTVSTREVFNGSECYVDAPFRKYHNLAESVEDHANFFVVNRRYAHALEVAGVRYGNPASWVCDRPQLCCHADQADAGIQPLPVRPIHAAP
jgi:flagellum-specific peptidoglycan hydrolase FlgJ